MTKACSLRCPGSMTMPRITVLIAASALLAGCNHHIHSPPARALPMESVAPVGKGRVGLAAEAAIHGAVFGPSLTSGGGRVRVSPHEDVDVSVEGNVLHVRGDAANDIDQNVYSARVGAKYRVVRWFALAGVLGGGYHVAGTFVSPDLGIIAAYENDYVVPYFSMRGFVSEPLAVRTVDTREAGSTTPERGAPQTTGGFATSLGVRVPMLPSFDQNEGVRGSLLLAPGLTHVGDAEDQRTFVQFGGGAELTF